MTTYPKIQSNMVLSGRASLRRGLWPRRPLRLRVRDCAAEIWRDLRAEWAEIKMNARAAAAALARCLFSRAALAGWLAVGVGCMASSFTEVDGAARPAPSPRAAVVAPALLTETAEADRETIQNNVWAEYAEAASQAPEDAPAADADEVRQKAWAKFFAGFYLSSFVALGFCARHSQA